jgi:hypothetical protein
MRKLGLMFALVMIGCTTGMSQHTGQGESFWVVETHSRDTIYSVVRFFDYGNRLLHEIRIDNVVIDIRIKKNRKHLDQLLSDYTIRTSRSAKKLKPKMSV